MLVGAFAPALGVQPDPKTAYAVARVPFSAYEVGQFDIAREDAATLSAIIGSSDSIFTGVIKPTAAGAICGLLCVWLQDVVAGQRGRIMLWGATYAQLIKASGNIGRGDTLTVNTDGVLSPDHTAGDRIVAVSLDPLTAPTTATEARVLFNGIHGMGQFVS